MGRKGNVWAGQTGGQTAAAESPRGKEISRVVDIECGFTGQNFVYRWSPECAWLARWWLESVWTVGRDVIDGNQWERYSGRSSVKQ